MHAKCQRNTHYLIAAVLPLLVVSSIMAQATAEKPTALVFTERVVAGGPKDFTSVRHLRLKGSQRAIGEKSAEIANVRHSAKPIKLGGDRGKKRFEFYKKDHPMHYQRALGAADYFKKRNEDGVDTSLLLYNFPDLGCSVVYYPPDQTETGNATLSRNYDFPTASWAQMLNSADQSDQRPNSADPYVIETYPDKGHPSLYVCAYELLGSALDGVNSKGLTVALLANRSNKEKATPTFRWKAGLSETEIVRYLLENCANVDEARAALQSIDFYYFLVPCHYIIGDRNGNSFVWEYSMDGKKRFNIEGKGQVQWVTNHALNEYPTMKDISSSLTSSTFNRFRRLNYELSKSENKHSLKRIKQTNLCVSAVGMPKEAGRTLWHAVYDCHNRSLDIDFYLGETRSGKQKRSGYLHFQLDE